MTTPFGRAGQTGKVRPGRGLGPNPTCFGLHTWPSGGGASALGKFKISYGVTGLSLNLTAADGGHAEPADAGDGQGRRWEALGEGRRRDAETKSDQQ